ncbi:MAG TPA: 30S ribosomal protein S21 [Candidatus Methylomirabilis sp.]|nr:30S ribosomal protein S21 [Candidatus Methylomirabilis sp.]
MAEVKRKKGETFDALLRRFQRRYQQSGRGIQTKKIRFHASEPSKTKRHRSALFREAKRKEFDYLMKTGKLKEEPKRPRRW